MTTESISPASFRDPSGYVFHRDGILYRRVNPVYREHYDCLMRSGLYERLTRDALLIPHEEADASLAASEGAYRTLKPRPVTFISYPYEWSFSQLKDAALATLRIQKIALEFGMSLKDASAYNIQFVDGSPCLIDTLSFEIYREGEPWVAYRQFCQHFLAPLALMSHTDCRLSQMLRLYIDGIPLDLASSLLPALSRLKLPLLLHIHLHARSQRHFAGKPLGKPRRGLSKFGLMALIDSLEGAVRRMRWKAAGTEWADYYDHTNYTSDAMEQKKRIVAQYIERAAPRTVWDLGANTGAFSHLAGEKGIVTLSFDIDPVAVERHYLRCRQTMQASVLPLQIDLTNPSPSIGWANRERMSLAQRGPADLAMALALIHHLAISNNVPLDRIASFFADICRSLIIEFVPKGDSQVQRLLASREDIFPDYRLERFEQAFSRHFATLEKAEIPGSERTLFLMARRPEP